MKILKVEQPGQSTQTGPVLRLQTGQRLAAIALTDAKPGDRAMLSVAGGQLQVTTQHPLKAGQAIDLEVTRLGQQVHLRPLGPPPDPRQLDQAQLTRNLLQALARLSPPGQAAPAASPGNLTSGMTTAPHVTLQAAQQAASSQSSAQGTQQTGAAAGQAATAPTPPSRSIQAFLSNQAASATAGESVARGTTSQATAQANAPAAAVSTTGAAQTVPAGLNGLLPLLSALREPRLVRGLVAGWLATQQNPSTQPNPLAGAGGAIPAPTGGLTETPLGAVLQQAARQLRARPDLAPSDPASRQATLDFMQRLGDQVERSQIGTALSQGAAGHAAGTQTGPNQPVWLLEIPLQLANEAHSLRMAIREEDGPEASDTEGRWQVDLAMDWPQLGPLHAALVLRGSQIDVDLFADRAETVSVLEASRATLARGLTDAGLSPGRLNAYDGPPPASVQARLEPDASADDHPAAQGFLSEQA
ncbi:MULTISPECIES: flagellar hook-length control protein FliK [unclassified Guyparkeria]|uniref:flagellar hook-length control protein FliK n=1 Tax=unclassified Guyparkeria TaxID=2626246 RepID=UPI0007339E86|nr:MULTISPECIES: flagellar hook-length control protein FliK [unclassified Guyparkeria]KTG17348.1 hypothetical protein AUR63_09365 [Guyparkeria sp. XI15]OAE87325.1 hypothetical protein AWR35_09385 [Guyparkeria sp. WRN-7]